LTVKGHVGITGVEENSVANLEFDNVIKANLLVSINKKQNNELKIIGKKGSIIISRPIVPNSKDFLLRLKKVFLIINYIKIQLINIKIKILLIFLIY
jgi:hypothetical protein